MRETLDSDSNDLGQELIMKMTMLIKHLLSQSQRFGNTLRTSTEV